MGAHRMRNCSLNWVGMTDAHNNLARVLCANVIERTDHTRLHLGKTLTVRETENTRSLLHRRPLWLFH